MMLVDANLLLYAVNGAAPDHARAAAWLDAALNGDDQVGLPWPSLMAFLRISTSAAVFRPPLPVEAAWEIVEEWLDLDIVWTPEPTSDHRATLARLVKSSRASGARLMDAHLAALAIEHGLTLVTTDSDFGAFKGLKWRNPLAGTEPT